jgi:beta-lactamase class A
MAPLRCTAALLLALLVAPAPRALAATGPTPSSPRAGAPAPAAEQLQTPPPPEPLNPAAGRDAGAARERAAREYLASIRPSAPLQSFLDRALAELAAADPALRRADLRVALLDLSRGEPPRFAHHQGDRPVYPASVVKLVYLMAAYAWRERGQLAIDPALDADLTAMIRESSNQATRRVFARLTATEPGPELPPEEYRAFRERRLAVKRWLAALGLADLHCVSPTYDGNGDLFGRDLQFLRDPTVAGGGPRRAGEYPNRQAMTATGTAKLLALLATDRALSPADSAAVRTRMRRDPRQQPHLAHRIAGGATRVPGVEVYAKSGTWGPIYADAGIVRDRHGRQLVLVVFTEARPPYRGTLIAELAHRAVAQLLSVPPAAAMPRNWAMAPSELDRRLAGDDLEILRVASAGGGVTGAAKLTLGFADGATVEVKWKAVPPRSADGWNNSPRKELAAYAVQRWLFDEADYVVPTPIARCIPLERYRPVDARARPSLPGTACVLGVAVLWMRDVAAPARLHDPERFARDPRYARHLADLNLLTYLIDHRDGRRGNFLISTDPADPRVFAVDNGISFDPFPWNFLVRNWHRIRVPWLRRAPIERLRAIGPAELRDLGTLLEMRADARGILRPVRPPGPNTAPSTGARVAPGWVQLGLTGGEIDDLAARVARLLERVDAGELRLEDAPAAPAT